MKTSGVDELKSVSDFPFVSVVVTVLNEVNTIVALLDSLANQSVRPDEIVIVDAGSKDGTLELLKNWHNGHADFDLTIIEEKKVNRSRARNLGIERARNELIAVTDAGCTAHSDWLREMLLALVSQSNTQAVAGFYLPHYKGVFDQATAPYLIVSTDAFKKTTFLPSSRSILFTKSAWSKVGRYPEYLDTCEDLVFAKRLKDGVLMVAQPRALVYWQLPESLFDFYKKVVGYARGDIEAYYVPHMKRIASLYWRYVLFLWIPWLFVVYLGWSLYRHRAILSKPDMWLFVPVVRAVFDVGVMMGALWGFGRRLISRNI